MNSIQGSEGSGRPGGRRPRVGLLKTQFKTQRHCLKHGPRPALGSVLGALSHSCTSETPEGGMRPDASPSPASGLGGVPLLQ